MVAEVQGECTNGQKRDKDYFACITGNEASRFEHQEPHAKTESAEEAAETLGYVFKNDGQTSKYQTRDNRSRDVKALEAS